MKNGDNKVEVLPPEGVNPADSGGVSKISLVPGKVPDTIKLVTPGNVKSEMGRIYRAVLKGKVCPDLGRTLIRDHLTPILKATEIEQAFNLAMDDPDADRPALAGLTITGPKVKHEKGVPARRLDGPCTSTTRPKKGKDNGDDKAKKEDG